MVSTAATTEASSRSRRRASDATQIDCCWVARVTVRPPSSSVITCDFRRQWRSVEDWFSKVTVFCITRRTNRNSATNSLVVYQCQQLPTQSERGSILPRLTFKHHQRRIMKQLNQRLTLVMRLTTRAANYEATQSETDTGDETYYTCHES